MDLLGAIEIASSGMTAQRARINIISMNLANVHTTRTGNGGPYRRKTVIFQTAPLARSFQEEMENSLKERNICGVKVTRVIPVKGEFKKIYDPSHPDADRHGYVLLPNVNPIQEVVEMLNASRSYEANAAAFRAAKEMALRALDLGR